MTDGIAFECEDCGNRVEDAPMRIAKCVECGGDMKLANPIASGGVDVDEIQAGDWVLSEYDTDGGRPKLVVGVDYGRERVWIVDTDETKPSPSYLRRQGVRAHIPRGERDVGDEPLQDARGPPQAPGSIPKYLREGLDKQSPDRLRAAAEYAEQLAAWKETKARREMEERAEIDEGDVPDEWDDDAWVDVVDDARDNADLGPGKGTITTKTIDGRDYYYLQWREGEKIRSQYVAPVTPAESD